MPNQQTLDLLADANEAIFKAEQAIRIEEGAACNGPMYRMRINLQEIIRRYCANLPVCDLSTVAEQIGPAKLMALKQQKPASD
jgi:hypothetical protein